MGGVTGEGVVGDETGVGRHHVRYSWPTSGFY